MKNIMNLLIISATMILLPGCCGCGAKKCNTTKPIEEVVVVETENDNQLRQKELAK